MYPRAFEQGEVYKYVMEILDFEEFPRCLEQYLLKVDKLRRILTNGCQKS